MDDFINPKIYEFIGKRKPKIFSDLFAGTGSVSKYFKNKYHCKIIASDLQLYSYILNKHFIVNNKDFSFKGLFYVFPELKKIKKLKDRREFVCSELNSLPGVKGYIYDNFCPTGRDKRQYFTDSNGMRGDAIRLKIKEWEEKKLINDNEYTYLLGCLIEAIDKVGNTTGVYGAYLKKIKKTAAKEMQFLDIGISENSNKNKVLMEDANIVARKFKHDVVYLDPPYNLRQYASNYHVLETIAEYNTDEVLRGKTGMRNYDSQKSKYSKKHEAYEALKDLVDNINANYIFISYNSDGLLKSEEIEEILTSRGEYKLEKFKFRRYKADNKRKNNEKELYEHLHCVKIKK